jgi:hypothetical protein
MISITTIAIYAINLLNANMIKKRGIVLNAILTKYANILNTDIAAMIVDMVKNAVTTFTNFFAMTVEEKEFANIK